MARIGKFRTVSNDEIAVVFFGENVGTSNLTLASSPVILQMDGGAREYIPVKYTTASVSCIYDGTDIFDIVTQDPLGVEVEIKNTTTGKMLFYGYVTTNSLNQPIDGYGDVVTIECVDWLGASKFVSYKKKNTGFSLSLITFGEVLQRIYTQLHTDYVNENIPAKIILSNHVYISDRNIFGVAASTDKYTTRYDKLTLSESYFYKHPTTPSIIDGVITLEDQALSCYEVLVMLAESVRATFIADGYSLLLEDVVARINGVADHFDLSTGESEQVGGVRVVDDAAFCGTGNTLTTMPRYELFSLTRQKSESPIFCNIFKSGYELSGAPILDREETLDRGVKQTYAQYLTSDMLAARVITDEAGSTTHPRVGLWACKSFEIYDKDYGVTPWLDDSWTKYIRVCEGLPSGQQQAYVAIKTSYTMPIPGAESYALVIKMSIGFSSEPDKLTFGDNPNGNLNGTPLSMNIKLGNKYYNVTTNTWENSSTDARYFVKKTSGGGWYDVFFVAKNNPENYLADQTHDGKLTINFLFDVGYGVYYIKNLDVSLVQSWRDDRELEATEYKGDRLTQMPYEEVASELTFGVPKTAKNYSGYVDGRSYVWSSYNKNFHTSQSYGAMDFHYTLDGARKVYSFLDRIELMATHGDGKEYHLNLKDVHGAISPLDIFTSEMWRGNKVCAGFTKDVEMETINITLD